MIIRLTKLPGSQSGFLSVGSLVDSKYRLNVLFIIISLKKIFLAEYQLFEEEEFLLLLVL